MPFLFIGVLALILCIYGLLLLGRASPAQVAEGIRNGGGVLALAAALFLLFRGRLALAAGLGGLSLYFFTGEHFSWKKFADMAARKKAAQKTSQVRTAFLAMTLDHVSGDVEGDVLEGQFAGQKLSALSHEQCLLLYRDCLARDASSARLLETYFDRRFAGWRAADQGDADSRGRAGRRYGASEMSEQEAYQTLGLRKGASAEEIVRAHRTLMKERHPDHGGTTDDAARINQAKDRLLRRHG